MERKVVESELNKGDRAIVKTQKNIYSKGDVQAFSNDIYLITDKKGKMNKMKNLNTG